jgi:hypothetical protein
MAQTIHFNTSFITVVFILLPVPRFQRLPPARTAIAALQKFKWVAMALSPLFLALLAPASAEPEASSGSGSGS